jgi:plasmid maintenance system antidote protein VapI
MRAPRKRWPKGTWMRLNSGALLRELMNTKRVSNADVALAAGCGRTFISALVNERRTSCTPKVAERIAERLEVPVTVLFAPKVSASSGQNVKGKRAA